MSRKFSFRLHLTFGTWFRTLIEMRLDADVSTGPESKRLGLMPGQTVRELGSLELVRGEDG